MTPSIKIEVRPTMDFWYDIMTVMVESGMDSVHYWAHVITIDRGQDLSVRYITLLEEGDPDDQYTIDPARVAEAVQKIIDGSIEVNEQIRLDCIRAVLSEDGAGDAGVIDALAADCIAQVAALDSIVYG